jgi:uncharacterized membrane protein
MRRSQPGLQILFVRLRSAAEQVRQSFFVLPALFVLAACVLAEGLLVVDSTISSQYLPPVFHTTVENARSLLGTIAGAVITVTGLVFSLAVVALQLASSQFSPRVLRVLFRSRFQQMVMGFMVGTFAYCLLVLRGLRSPLQSGDQPVIPSISIVGALVLGVGAGLAILAYVNHIAHLLQVSEIIRRTTHDTLEAIHHLTRAQEDQGASDREPPPFPEEGHVVYARQSGWVQQVNNDALLGAIPEHTILRLDVRAGSYIPQGGALGTIGPPPQNTIYTEMLIRLAIKQGPVRTTQEDIAFGLTQLNDITLRALSPGINDPNTAYEVIVHLGEVLHVLLSRTLPPTSISGEKDRQLVRPLELTHVDYINQTFDQIRIASVNHPSIAMILLKTFGALLQDAQHSHNEGCVAALQHQAILVLKGAKAASPLPEDLERITIAARDAGFEPESISV